MKRLAVFLVVLGFAAAGLVSALDFGGTIDNTTGYFTNGVPPFDQTNKLSIWFNDYIGKNLFFDTQISGNYQNQTTYGGGYVGLYADLDRLSLEGQFTNPKRDLRVFGFDVGRFPLVDPTSVIYNQSIDGFNLTFGFQPFSISATAGYTGLTIKPSSTIIMSAADLNGLTNTSQYFGSPRVVGLLTFTAPSLLYQQDLTLSVLAQEDMRPFFPNNGLASPGDTVYSPNTGGAIDSQYFTLRVSGPIVSTFFWNGSFTFESGSMLSYITAASQYEYKPILAYLAHGGLRYFIPAAMNLAMGLEADYASGDPDFVSLYGGNSAGNATAFIPITQGTLAAVFSPQLTNLITGTLSFSIKPLSRLHNSYLSNLQLELKGIPFWQAAGNIVSNPGNVNTPIYLGTEIDGTINYRPVSDLGVSVSGGAFAPKGYFSSGAPLQYGVKMDASFSF